MRVVVQLTLSDGIYSLWGQEKAQQLEPPTARCREFVRYLSAQYEQQRGQQWPREKRAAR